METKFTKTEWWTDKENTTSVFVGNEGIEIQVWHYAHQKEEAEANAKLISAAPEMFDILSDTVRKLELLKKVRKLSIFESSLLLNSNDILKKATE